MAEPGKHGLWIIRMGRIHGVNADFARTILEPFTLNGFRALG